MDLTKDERENLLSQFEAATSKYSELVCRAYGSDGFEAIRIVTTDDAFVPQQTAGRDVAIDWITNRVNEGYHVAFKVGDRGESADIILKYWEYPDTEPDWPSAGQLAASPDRPPGGR